MDLRIAGSSSTMATNPLCTQDLIDRSAHGQAHRPCLAAVAALAQGTACAGTWLLSFGAGPHQRTGCERESHRLRCRRGQRLSVRSSLSKPARALSIVPWLRCVLAAVVGGWLCVAPAAADVPEARVLILNALDPYLPAYQAIDSAMRAQLAGQTDQRIVLYSELLDAQRFGAESLEPELLALLAKSTVLRVDVRSRSRARHSSSGVTASGCGPVRGRWRTAFPIPPVNRGVSASPARSTATMSKVRSLARCLQPPGARSRGLRLLATAERWRGRSCSCGAGIAGQCCPLAAAWLVAHGAGAVRHHRALPDAVSRSRQPVVPALRRAARHQRRLASTRLRLFETYVGQGVAAGHGGAAAAVWSRG